MFLSFKVNDRHCWNEDSHMTSSCYICNQRGDRWDVCTKSKTWAIQIEVKRKGRTGTKSLSSHAVLTRLSSASCLVMGYHFSRLHFFCSSCLWFQYYHQTHTSTSSDSKWICIRFFVGSADTAFFHDYLSFFTEYIPFLGEMQWYLWETMKKVDFL